MKRTLARLAGFLFSLVLTACGDLPTASPASDLAGAGPVLSGDCMLQDDRTFLSPPETPIWVDGCDWYQDCGGDCMAGAGKTPADGSSVQGCTGGGDDGGGGPIGDGDAPGGPGGGSGGDDGGGGDDGSGSKICPDYGCPPPDDPACDPAIDPDCEQPLTQADSATILNAIATMLRPASSFTDSIARRDCEQMRTWFNNAFAAGAVYRGASDSDHYGMYNSDNSNIHFDPLTLDGANAGDQDAIREIAITGLHEAAHAMGFLHPTPPTFDAQGRDYYVDHPFNRLNPGPNSCVPR